MLYLAFNSVCYCLFTQIKMEKVIKLKLITIKLKPRVKDHFAVKSLNS